MLFDGYNMKQTTRKLHAGKMRALNVIWNENLLKMLNNEPIPGVGADASKRVQQLLHNLFQLEESRAVIRKLARGKRSDADKVAKLNVESMELAEQINRQLRRYTWFPEVRFTLPDGLVTYRLHWKTRSEGQSCEYHGTWTFLDHMQAGQLDRFRRCIQCDTWFYATAGHQRFCGDTCRMQSHSNSAEFRKQRARYMRENYRPTQRELSKKGQRYAGV